MSQRRKQILMRNFLLLSVLSFLLPALLLARGDSMSYAINSDTVFLKLSELQEKLIAHKLEGSQTLYGLSKCYGLTVNEIFDYNPGLDRNSYGQGIYVDIPVPSMSILTQIPVGENPYDYVPLCYVVRKSDTLYKLSKNYFGVPMSELVMLNQLVDNTLSLGQVIQVGWMSRNGIPKTHRKFRGGPVDKKNQLLARKYNQAAGIKREYKQKGVAYWQSDGVKSVDLYAMHRKAPVGSVIAITNPMSKRTVYAVVIAEMPDAIYSEDVVVVVSTRVAKLLGGKDARFFVKVRYLR